MTPISSKQNILVVFIFLAAGFLVYSNTLDVPFHFDDAHVVSDLSFEKMLEKCKGGGSRVIAHLTFLLNYWLGGSDVFGYHFFNTLVHIGTAYLVYLFLYQILSLANRLERLEQLERFERFNNRYTSHGILPSLSDPVFWPAFMGGMLFLVHPLATQAVTYITQRYASLAGFFYVGALAFFVTARIRFNETGNFLSRSHLVAYLTSLLMAVLAMRTKEMAITLPAAAALTEYYFVQSDLKEIRRRMLYLLPILSTGLIIPVSAMLGIETISLESVAALQGYSWGEEIARKDYLFTQFKVILGIYLRLVLWPVGQNIDHDYAISKSLLETPTLFAFIGLCVVLMAGLRLFKRARLVSFGIVWFVVTILPTSSIVPNTEFVAEHRVYISLMGLPFAVAGLPQWRTRWKTYLPGLLLALLVLSSLAYARNKAWESDLALWQDSAAKSPKKARPHYNLGVVLQDRGRLKEAMAHYSEAIRIRPDYLQAHNNLGNALAESGYEEDAVSHYRRALRIDPSHARPHNNLAVALMNLGDLEEAISHYSEALRLMPDFAEAHGNMGLALAAQGRHLEAAARYSEALRLKPDYADAHYHLGNALSALGRTEEAVRHYSEAIRIRPAFAEAHCNLGAVLTMQGDLERAVIHSTEALRLKPDYADAHNNMGVVLAGLGRIEEAVGHYSEALRLRPDYADAKANLERAMRLPGK